jgi:hypothetical protein
MIILILYSLVHICEAWLEEAVIALKNYTDYNYQQLNRKEHSRSAWFALLLFVCFALFLVYRDGYWLLPAMIVNRRVFFDYGLILFRNRPRNLYEGNDWWVKRFVWVFGKKGRRIELLLELLVTVASIVAYCLTENFIWI